MQKQNNVKIFSPINDKTTSSTNPSFINNIQNKNKNCILYKKSLVSNTFKKIKTNYKNKGVIVDYKNHYNINQNLKNKYPILTKETSKFHKKEINNITNDTSNNNNIEFHSTILNSSKSTYSILLKGNSKIKNTEKNDKFIDDDNKKVIVLYKKNMVRFKKPNYNKSSSSDIFRTNNNCIKVKNSKFKFPKHQAFNKNNKKIKIIKNINLSENKRNNKTSHNIIKKNKSQFYNKHKFIISQNKKSFTIFLEKKQQQKALSSKKFSINNNKNIIVNKNNNEKKTKRVICNTKSVKNIFHNQLSNINNYCNKMNAKENKINNKIKTIKLNKISKNKILKNKNIEIPTTNNNNNNNNLSNTKPTNFSSFINSEKNGLSWGMISTKQIEEFNLNNNKNTIITESEVNKLQNKKFSNFLEHMKFLYINSVNPKYKQDSNKMNENESKFLNYDLGQTNGLSLMLDSILHSNINITLSNIDKNNKEIYANKENKNSVECEKTVGELEKIANQMFENSNLIGNDNGSNEDLDIEEFKEGEDIQKILSMAIKTKQ